MSALGGYATDTWAAQPQSYGVSRLVSMDSAPGSTLSLDRGAHGPSD
jgi:hypothetical protein